MEGEQLMSAEEICRRFDIPRGTLYHLIKQGRIPARDISKPYYRKRRWAFDPAEVAAALDRLRTG